MALLKRKTSGFLLASLVTACVLGIGSLATASNASAQTDQCSAITSTTCDGYPINNGQGWAAEVPPHSTLDVDIRTHNINTGAEYAYWDISRPNNSNGTQVDQHPLYLSQADHDAGWRIYRVIVD